VSLENPIFHEALEKALPEWMSLKPFRHWLGIGVSIALVVDALIEGLFEGRNAAFPGQVRAPDVEGLGGFNNVDALPFIGRDRRIVRGFAEPPEAYARRLRQWRAAWRSSATPFGMLTQLRGVLVEADGVTFPMVRLVNAAGVWHTIEPDGSLVYNTPDGDGFRISPTGAVTVEPDPAHPWDWDSASTPPVDPDPFRAWAIVYAPTSPPLVGDAGTYGDGLDNYGDPEGTIGTSTTPAHVDMIKGLLAEWNSAGIVLDWIIIAFDPASFDPLEPGPYPAAGMPDGTWAHWGVDVDVGGGELHRVPARLATARYWRGAPG
jgi:hypothetical protein